ncbi:MAG: thiamine phosphate synthase [Alphaproteobacteria bacterium]|nr:MAG: thiamine phosphate synthase [Alphaproteobacteria bacterium]
MVKPAHKEASMKADALRIAAGVERLVFITDQARVPDPETVCRRLGPQDIVICRDYEHADRRALARMLRAVTAERGQTLLVAGDENLAKAVGADGLHLPGHLLGRMQGRPAFGFVSAACHTKPDLVKARRLGLDLALLSPVFPTESHPDARTLGTLRLAGLVRDAGVPVAALGGITRKTALGLKGIKLAAIAGIGCFLEI